MWSADFWGDGNESKLEKRSVVCPAVRILFLWRKACRKTGRHSSIGRRASPSILRTFSCHSGTQAGSARNTAPLFHRKRKFPAARPEIPLPPDCRLTVYLQKKRLFSTNFFVFLLHCFSARPRHFAEISCFRKNAACGGFHTAENMV